MYDNVVDVPRLLHTYGAGEPLPPSGTDGGARGPSRRTTGTSSASHS